MTSPYLQCCTQSLKYQQHFLNTILTITCARIPTIISFLHLQSFLHSHWHVTLSHFRFELHVVLLNLHLQNLHEICSVIALTLSLFVIILNALTLMCLFLLEHIILEIRCYNFQYIYLN